MRGGVLLGGMIGIMLLAGCRAPAPARYAADFREGAPGWLLPRDPRFQARVEDGRLILTLQPARTVAWAFSPFTFREGQVEVEAALLEGPSSADYGLVLEAGPGRLYRFAVSADGYYGIFLYEQGHGERRSTGPPMRPSEPDEPPTTCGSDANAARWSSGSTGSKRPGSRGIPGRRAGAWG
jgi:hypothetical protein